MQIQPLRPKGGRTASNPRPRLFHSLLHTLSPSEESYMDQVQGGSFFLQLPNPHSLLLFCVITTRYRDHVYTLERTSSKAMHRQAGTLYTLEASYVTVSATPPLPDAHTYPCFLSNQVR